MKWILLGLWTSILADLISIQKELISKEKK